MTYKQPKCEVPECCHPADCADVDGVWCARHTLDALLHRALEECARCGRSGAVDAEELCGPCARDAADFEDRAHWDRRIG